MAQVRGQIDTLQQAITEGDQTLIALRADQIVSGRKNDEQYELAAITLSDQRKQLWNLEAELKALVMAEHTVEQTCRETDRVARGQAAQCLLDDYRRSVAKLESILAQAEAANDELLQLDAQLRASGLGETGASKTLTTLSRSGASWNALAYPLKVGSPIHVHDWRAHVQRVLNAE
jgi:hypothetical protein